MTTLAQFLKPTKGPFDVPIESVSFAVTQFAYHQSPLQSPPQTVHLAFQLDQTVCRVRLSLEFLDLEFDSRHPPVNGIDRRINLVRRIHSRRLTFKETVECDMQIKCHID